MPAEHRFAGLGHFAREVWLRLRLHPIRNLLIIGFVIASIVGLGTATAMLSPTPSKRLRETTAQAALAALDEGEFARARDLAVDLRKSDNPQDVRGQAAFVLGVTVAHDAHETRNDRERRMLFLLASRYLDESRVAGWPRGREAAGQWQLARCLFESGRFAESIPELEKALGQCPNQKTEICRRLALACMQIPEPRPLDALKYSRLFLADARLPADVRHDALLVQARILLEQSQFDECRAALSQIPADSNTYTEAALLLARLTLLECDGEARQAAGNEQKLAEVQEKSLALRASLAELRKRPGIRVPQYLQATLLLGLACRRLGEDRAALDAVSEVSRSGFGTPEGLAAVLEEAELRVALDQDEASLDAYRRLVRQIDDVHLYNNSWVTLPKLRERLEQAYQVWCKNQRFDAAFELAQSLRSVLGDERAVELQAEAQEGHAEHLDQLARQASAAERESLAADARIAWRKAGAVRRDLARLRFAKREYPDVLWRAADDYRRGHAYPQAVDLLKQYLKQAERPKSPPALTALGESLLALNQPQEALVPLNECIEYHADDPHSYRARLLAADAFVELGKRAEAKTQLLRNLNQESLTPRSVEWRESLDRLGHILYEEGLEHETQARMNGLNSQDPEKQKQGLKDLELAVASYQEALTRLSETVERVEPGSAGDSAERTHLARYLVAECHRRSASLPRKKLVGVTIETLRAAINRQLRQELESAIQCYTSLQARLNAQQDESELTELEKRILRNCYFAQAAALSELGRFDEAIRACHAATTRYQREPECLQAYVQMVTCLRRLGRNVEARGAIEQAKVALRQIPAEADFSRTTCYPREQWTQMLDWMGTL